MIRRQEAPTASDDAAYRSGRPKIALVVVSAVALVACVYVSSVDRSTPSSLARGDEPRAIYGQGCKLAQFIPMTACKKDVTSPNCCAALRAILDDNCICRPLPSVVLSHGGEPKVFLLNFLGCNLTADGMDPVDFVTAKTTCADQRSWCADGRHARDVRLDSSPIGRVQMWDGDQRQWRYATPGWRDEDGAMHYDGDGESAAHFVCRAMGYERMRGWGLASPQGESSVGFALGRCGPEAVERGDVRGCSPTAISHSGCPRPRPGQAGAPCRIASSVTPRPQPLWVDCKPWPAIPQWCLRPEQPTWAERSQAQCVGTPEGRRTGLSAPLGDAQHERAVGAAHMVCGTAGINESRIAWADGFWDSERAYVRAHGYPDPPVLLWRGQRPGAMFAGLPPPELPPGEWDPDAAAHAPPPPRAHSPPPALPTLLPSHSPPPMSWLGVVVAVSPPPIALAVGVAMSPPPRPMSPPPPPPNWRRSR